MNKETFFEEIKSYKLLANKSLGQNFLINPSIAENIVSSLDVKQGDKVLEIGAGLGSLSCFLKETNSNITLIDVDERMLSFLKEHFGESKNIDVRRQNILKEDLSNYTKIIGNLPYYITSGIIEHVLLNAVNADKIVLMTQKEVYPKLLKSFKSPLSLFLNYVCEISQSSIVNKNNFVPVPHVESVYFSLTPNENIKNEDNKELYKLMKIMFLHRRKTMLNCLFNIVKEKDKCAQILEISGVNPLFRPEQLSIEDYKAILKQSKSQDFMIKI